MITKFKTNTAYYPYSASKCGKIKNLETGNILSVVKQKSGYCVFNTRRFGTAYVHRAVAEIWIPNNDLSKDQVNHIDGVKSNNHLDNLEWVTRSENMQHAADTGLLSLNCLYGEDCNLTLFSDEIIHSVCKDLEKGHRNVDVSRRYSISPAYVKDLKAGKQRKDITSQYIFPKFKRRSLSEDTVIWICERISEGLTNREIIGLTSNSSITKAVLKNIRHKKCYADISCNYFK